MKSPYEYIPPPDEPLEQAPDLKNKDRRTIGFWVSLILLLAAFSVGYRLIVYSHLEQTAVMFIGLPTIMAIALSVTPSAKSITGRICKGMTMFFLLLGILAIEGLICILMAAPLFYLIGIIIGGIADLCRRKNKKNMYSIAILALVLSSLEGINEALSFDREETVTVEQHLPLSQQQVKLALAAGPEFDLNQLPMFLKLGFPQPKSIQGSGCNIGDQWNIHFAGGEGTPGDLVVEVTDVTDSTLTLTNLKDTSHIAHWLHWRSVTWQFDPQDQGTKVSMHIHYRRDLDPAWYFKPIERYGVKKAAEYFIQQTFKTR